MLINGVQSNLIACYVDEIAIDVWITIVHNGERKQKAGDGEREREREKEHSCPAAVKAGGKKTWWTLITTLSLFHTHAHTVHTNTKHQGPQMVTRHHYKSAYSLLGAIWKHYHVNLSPSLSLTHTHTLAPSPAHRHQSVGFNWVLSVYHWVDGSKQLQTQTVPGTPLRSAWFSDSHTWGALVIYNLNSRGVLVLLTSTTVEHLFYKTLCKGHLFSYISGTPENHLFFVAVQPLWDTCTSVLVRRGVKYSGEKTCLDPLLHPLHEKICSSKNI